MDIYDGADWTEMDIDDLKASIEGGASIEDAAEFLPLGLDRRRRPQGARTRAEAEAEIMRAERPPTEAALPHKHDDHRHRDEGVCAGNHDA